MDDISNAFTSWSHYNPLQKRCVTCSSATLTCPVCSSDEVCVQTSRTCTSCASRSCVSKNLSGANTTATSTGSHGPRVGAIVGGVVAGVVVIAVVTYLIWRFIIKPKRRAYVVEYQEQVGSEDSYMEKDIAGAIGRPRAGSTQTRGSIASTALTRASNVIPIAFIPGILAGPEAFQAVPPVPPVPIPLSRNKTSATASVSALASPYLQVGNGGVGGDHYFMPGDLRDSSYSGFSDDGASSIRSHGTPGHQSITPSLLRGSVASTIYRNDAVISTNPAQTAHRGRAAVVSVKPGGAAGVPAVPKVDYQRFSGLQRGPLGVAGVASDEIVSLNAAIASSSAGAGATLPATTFAARARNDGARGNGMAVIEEATGRASAMDVRTMKGKADGRGSRKDLAREEEAAQRERERSSIQRGESPFSDDYAVVDL